LALKGITPSQAIKKVEESGLELALSPSQAIKVLGESGFELSPEQQLIMEEISKEFIDLAKKKSGRRDRAKLIKQFAKRVLQELSLPNAIGIASYTQIYIIAVLLFTLLASSIKANEREVVRKLEDTLQEQPATEQQEQQLSELKAPKLTARLKSEIAKIKTIQEFQSVQAALDTRGRELGYQKPSVIKHITSQVSKLRSLDDCREVEVTVKQREDELKAKGQVTGPAKSLAITTIRGTEMFCERWQVSKKLHSRTLGPTLPPKYNLSKVKVSFRARKRLEQLGYEVKK